MVLIFDLDDTLYPERSFVLGGFAAVAAMLEDLFGWDSSASLDHMVEILDTQGRGTVFNELLAAKNRNSAGLVQKCLQVYRGHRPAIDLYPEAKTLLGTIASRPIYIVTDGNKNVQANKVRALGLDRYFKKIFITHRHGTRHAKPSIYCFELIRRLEACTWNDMVYVGDNPAKDFVNLNPLGMQTVRVLTGGHAQVKAQPGFDANVSIPSLGYLQPVLNGMA